MTQVNNPSINRALDAKLHSFVNFTIAKIRSSSATPTNPALLSICAMCDRNARVVSNSLYEASHQQNNNTPKSKNGRLYRSSRTVAGEHEARCERVSGQERVSLDDRRTVEPTPSLRETVHLARRER